MIDADVLVKDLLEQIPLAENVPIFKDIIESQPTAYDTYNVVVRLKNASYELFWNTGMCGELVVSLDDVIEIIKGGGKIYGKVD